MPRKAPPDSERCTAVVRIGAAADDVADCMRRRLPGCLYFRQHNVSIGTAPAARRYRRNPTGPLPENPPMPTDTAVALASAELGQLRGPLSPDHWNRLYWRCVYAMRRLPDRARRPVQVAWELVMERRTGTRVFFMPHTTR